MKVIILAAGYATRLYPLTLTQPKPNQIAYLIDQPARPHPLDALLDPRVEHVGRHTATLSHRELGRADVHPPVELHAVGVDDLTTELQRQLDSEVGLPRRSWPDHCDHHGRGISSGAHVAILPQVGRAAAHRHPRSPGEQRPDPPHDLSGVASAPRSSRRRRAQRLRGAPRRSPIPPERPPPAARPVGPQL